MITQKNLPQGTTHHLEEVSVSAASLCVLDCSAIVFQKSHAQYVLHEIFNRPLDFFSLTKMSFRELVVANGRLLLQIWTHHIEHKDFFWLHTNDTSSWVYWEKHHELTGTSFSFNIFFNSEWFVPFVNKHISTMSECCECGKHLSEESSKSAPQIPAFEK